MKYDSIVIGSGLSGLTNALLLARSGRRVLVLEQHAQPAPVVRGFSRGGQYFDSGFHYAGGLGDDGAFRPLFRHLGLEDKLELFPFAAILSELSLSSSRGPANSGKRDTNSAGSTGQRGRKNSDPGTNLEDPELAVDKGKLK